MRKLIFKSLARLNKKVLPSYSKKGLQIEKASKLQLAIIAYRAWVLKNALK